MAFETEYSSFPNQKITLHHFKNVDDKVSELINNINSDRAKGTYNHAAKLIKDNYDTLSQYIVDATTFRTWEEEIYNTQIYAKQKQQCIYFDTDEPDALYSDVWIGGDWHVV